MAPYPKIAQFKDPASFRARLRQLHSDLPLDDQALSAPQGSPLSWPFQLGNLHLGNRWCIHPMEGWDATPAGAPSPLTHNRWRNFGKSGAKLIWGCEAVAVQPDGRANPRQLLALPEHLPALAAALADLKQAHREAHGRLDDLLVGLQLTHSGRFSRPVGSRMVPRVAYRHPLLDARFAAVSDELHVWTDDELERLVDRYVAAALLAHRAGFDFVDIKACHGYLLHEFLSARRRPGPFGGDLAGRTRLLTAILGRIRDACPALLLGVRLSVFDAPPFSPSPAGGVPCDYHHLLPYDCGFGLNPDDPLQIDLAEPIELLRRLQSAGVSIVNLSAGSPYYNPHIQRPASFPPSDGYPPPEDPLAGVIRLIEAARDCKQALPDLPLVGTGYTYLQEFLPHVAQAVVRAGWIDFVGLGRLVLSYPQLPSDLLSGKIPDRKRLCRTFSDCTTAPRQGLISGCYPLDPTYRDLPEAEQLKRLKNQLRTPREI